VEREFGVLKHQWAMPPLKARRLSWIQMCADLTILARLVDAVVLMAASAVNPPKNGR